MNYVRLLNAFEDYSDRTGLPAYAQLIYYKLFAMNNRAGWVEWFETTNPYLMFKTGIKDEGTFIRHRNTLKQHELIDFISGKKGQPTKYTLIKIYEDHPSELSTNSTITGINQVNMPVKVPVNMPRIMPVKVPVNMPDIYKLNETKTKIINNSACEDEIVDNSTCQLCNGKGWYVGEQPFNNGLGKRDAVIQCSCKSRKPAWANRLAGG